MNKDTLLHHVVLQPSQLLYHDVDEASDESRQDANQPTDEPAAELQTPKALHKHTAHGNSYQADAIMEYS